MVIVLIILMVFVIAYPYIQQRRQRVQSQANA